MKRNELFFILVMTLHWTYAENLDIEINNDNVVQINDEDLINLEKRYQVKEDSNITPQILSSSNTLFLDGTSYAIDDVTTPIQMFTKNATYMHNGISQRSLPRYSITQKDYDDEIVTVIKSEKGEVKTITINNKSTQKNVELRAISPVTFTMLQDSDIDYNELNGKFFYGETKHELDEERHVDDAMTAILEEHNASISQQSRACTVYNEIELAVAYESSFCNSFTDKESADIKAISIVKDVSIKYQQESLCTKVKISHLEGYCDPESDPYKKYVDMNQSGCISEGLLDEVKEYWKKNRKTVHRDVMQFFSGTGLECTDQGCIIGCAYTGHICNEKKAYGVNYITFSRSPKLQSVLVAHELGHNCGAAHEPRTNYIMTNMVNPASNGFSSESITSITKKFKQTTCVSEVEEAQPTSSPTRNPTPLTTLKSPSLSPSLPPTKHPTNSPTKHPTYSPTKHPTYSPTKHPTDSPTKHPTFLSTSSPSGFPTSYTTSSPNSINTSPSTSSPTSSITHLPTRQYSNPISSITSTISPSISVNNVPTGIIPENPSVGSTYRPTPPFASSLICRQSLKVFSTNFNISSKVSKILLRLFEKI